MSKFGTLLRTYRERATRGFQPPRQKWLSQASFAAQLYTVTGLDYSYGSIKGWEKGKYVIAAQDRLLLTGLIHSLRKCEGILTRAEANALLQAGGYRDLSDEECEKIDPAWLDSEAEEIIVPVEELLQPLGVSAEPLHLAESIETLMTQLTSSDAYPLVVLTGPGGSGKTTLAAAVMRRLDAKSQFDRFAFVSVDPALPAKQQIATALDVLGRQLLGSAFNPNNVETQLNAFFKKYAVCAVIDGLQRLELVDAWCEKLRSWAGKTRFVLTSRAEPETTDVYLDTLEEFDFAAAMQLMRQTAAQKGRRRARAFERLSEADKRHIYSLVGGNPQALIWATVLLGRVPISEFAALIGEQDAGQQMLRDMFAGLTQQLAADADRLLTSLLFIGANGARFETVQQFSGLRGVAFWAAHDELLSLSLIQDSGSEWLRAHALTQRYLENRPVSAENYASVITYWLKRLDALPRDRWHLLDPEWSNLIRIIAVTLQRDAIPSELLPDLLKLARLICRFVTRRGRRGEWLPLLLQLLARDEVRDSAETSQIQTRLYSELGIFQRNERQIDTALQTHLHAHALAQQINHQTTTARILFHIATDYRMLGDWAASTSYAKQALQQAAGSKLGEGACHNLLGLIALGQGEWDAAIAAFQTALDLFLGLSNAREVARTRLNLALAHRRQGDSTAALAQINAAQLLLAVSADLTQSAELHLQKCAAHLMDNAFFAAQQSLAQLDPEQLAAVGERELLGRYWQQTARLALLQGENNWEAMTQSLALLDNSANVVAAVEATALHIQMLLQAERQAEAQQHIATARSRFMPHQQYALVREQITAWSILNDKLSQDL